MAAVLNRMLKVVAAVGVASCVDGCGDTKTYRHASKVEMEAVDGVEFERVESVAVEKSEDSRAQQPSQESREKPFEKVDVEAETVVEEAVVPEKQDDPKLADKPLEEVPPPQEDIENKKAGEDVPDVVDVPKEVEMPRRPTDHEVLKGFPQGKEQLSIICSRQKNDVIRQKFCVQEPPQITSLVDLQQVIGLDFKDRSLAGIRNNGRGGNPSFTLTGHSSSLVARSTNQIVPRAIIFSPANNLNPDDDFVAMGFVRGDQFVEIVSKDPDSGNLSFFLVAFEQQCNSKEEGCHFGELLSPDIESNWTKVSIYEDEDLKNTILDCLHCHQPNGPGTAKFLRMQELKDPWTHFFRSNRQEGRAILADYALAHDINEDYAGIPGGLISSSDPRDLENLVRANGFESFNLAFDTATIRDEINASSPGQPFDNSIPGESTTWEAVYKRSVAGEIIPIPYHDAKVSNQVKLEEFAQLYRDMMSGSLPKAELPDIRQAFKNDRKIGFQVEEGLNGKQILVQACRQCHHGNLDQSLSRAKFNVDDLSNMSRLQKNIAIGRLKLPPSDLRAMPPRLVRDLSEKERQLAIEELLK